MIARWLLPSAFALQGCLCLSISTPQRLPVLTSPTQLDTTENTIALSRISPVPGSSAWSIALSRAGVLGRQTTYNSTNTTLTSVEIGANFLATIMVGGQQFDVVVDTGSSDTWLVLSNFTCVSGTHQTYAQSNCRFASTYTPSSTLHYIASENFNITYADGETLTGLLAHENMTLASIDVSQQEIALVDYAAWYGDGVSSGLLGLAYPRITNAYAGSNPQADQPGDNEPYAPVFTNMYESGLVAPMFALALQRPTNYYATQEAGGYLSIGGIPSVPHDPYFASTPISSIGIESTDAIFEFYSITIDGYAVSQSPYVQFNVLGSTATNPLKQDLLANGTQVIVDSGTTLLYVPDSVAAAAAAAFDPPAYVTDSGLYGVACDARAPLFGVAIGSKVFFVNTADLVLYEVVSTDAAQDVCYMGVQPAGDVAGNVLGDVFLRNVLAVFDVGAAEMRFAARED